MLDTALATNPRAQDRKQDHGTYLRFTKDKAEKAVRAEFRTEFLLRLCDCARDALSPQEKALDKILATNPKAQERFEFLRRQPDFTLKKVREKLKVEFKDEYLWRLDEISRGGLSQKNGDVPEAPRYPEHRVKQFVRENRLAKVTADADRLHGVLYPMAGPATGEQIRDVVRDISASRSQEEVNQLRNLYRERWLKGAKEGEPQDLDTEIYAKLAGNIQLHDQCEASLHPAAAEPHSSPGR